MKKVEKKKYVKPAVKKNEPLVAITFASAIPGTGPATAITFASAIPGDRKSVV